VDPTSARSPKGSEVVLIHMTPHGQTAGVKGFTRRYTGSIPTRGVACFFAQKQRSWTVSGLRVAFSEQDDGCPVQTIY